MSDKHSIHITEQDGKVTLAFEGSVTFPLALQMIFTALKNIATVTAEATYNSLEKKTPACMREIRGDIADEINAQATGLLEQFCPKDPDLELSEVAIATIENEIIAYAKRNNLSIKQAVKQYQDHLLAESPYSAEKSRKKGGK